MRLLCQPAAEHGRVWRQVVNAIHVRKPQALLASVVVVHPLRQRTPLGISPLQCLKQRGCFAAHACLPLMILRGPEHCSGPLKIFQPTWLPFTAVLDAKMRQ